MRASLRSVLAGACGLCAVLFAVTPAAASDAGPQHSSTPNVTAEIGFDSEQVHPGGQDTMTVNLINHGPQRLDDQTSVHLTVTTPQNTEVDPTVMETIPGNAPAGSSNAVPAKRSVPLTQVFVRSAPGFFDVVVPAGSFGNSATFRTYTFTLHVSPKVVSGAQLVGAGVAVALENYVGLTVAKSVTPPPPVVVAVTPKPSHKPKPHKTPSTRSTAGSSERIQWTAPACPAMPGSNSGNGSTSSGTSGGMSGGTSGGSAAGGGSGGWGQCVCPGIQQMSTPSGSSSGGPTASSSPSSGGNSGTSGGSSSQGGGAQGGALPCTVPTLAATGTSSTWPLAVGVLAVVVGAALIGVTQRFGRRTARDAPAADRN